MRYTMLGLVAGLLVGGAAEAADLPQSRAEMSQAQAEAQRLTVELRLSGTAYQGPPEFTLLADGEEVGRGEVTYAYDTAGEEAREVTPELLAAHTQDFAFELPAGRDPQVLEIVFLEDAWGGADQPQRDRNLYVLSATVAGRQYGPNAFALPEEGATWVGEAAVGLLVSGAKARLERPEGGWRVDAEDDAEPAQSPE